MDAHNIFCCLFLHLFIGSKKCIWQMNGAHYQIEQSILSGNSLNFVCMCHLKRSHSVDVIAMMHISHTNTHMHTTFKIQCRMHHLDALHFPSYSIFCCRFYGTENKKLAITICAQKTTTIWTVWQKEFEMQCTHRYCNATQRSFNAF